MIMSRIFFLIMFSLAIVVEANAKSREGLMTDSLKTGQQLPPSKENQLEMQLEVADFLMRQDSAMLTKEANFLKEIDPTYVNPRQKEYYEYLMGVLLVQEEIKKVESTSQSIMDLEEKLKAHRKEIVTQVESLRKNTNTLIDNVNSEIVKLSPEHDLYLDNLIKRVIVIRNQYKASPSSQKGEKK